eukprot:gene5114-4861_t
MRLARGARRGRTPRPPRSLIVGRAPFFWDTSRADVAPAPALGCRGRAKGRERGAMAALAVLAALSLSAAPHPTLQTMWKATVKEEQVGEVYESETFVDDHKG